MSIKVKINCSIPYTWLTFLGGGKKVRRVTGNTAQGEKVCPTGPGGAFMQKACKRNWSTGGGGLCFKKKKKQGGGVGWTEKEAGPSTNVNGKCSRSHGKGLEPCTVKSKRRRWEEDSLVGKGGEKLRVAFREGARLPVVAAECGVDLWRVVLKRGLVPGS